MTPSSHTPAPHVVELCPYEADPVALHDTLSVVPGSHHADELAALARAMEPVARPRACWRAAEVEHAGAEAVRLNGVDFRSRILARYMAEGRRAFPYIATAGPEVEAWREGVEGTRLGFWAEALAEQALFAVIGEMVRTIEADYPGEACSEMHPGSLKDWPLSEQRPLFAVLEPVPLGVELLDTLVMWPPKTTSGIRFGSDEPFVSCLLCPRPSCRSRRAEYDAALAADVYGPETDGEAGTDG